MRVRECKHSSPPIRPLYGDCPAHTAVESALPIPFDCINLCMLLHIPVLILLVLSHGIKICDLNVDDVLILDHFPLFFNLEVPLMPSKFPLFSCPKQLISFLTVQQFSMPFFNPYTNLMSSDDLLHLFQSSCLAVLDQIVPLKTKSVNFTSDSWLNQSTNECISRLRECKKAERKLNTNKH